MESEYIMRYRCAKLFGITDKQLQKILKDHPDFLDRVVSSKLVHKEKTFALLEAREKYVVDVLTEIQKELSDRKYLMDILTEIQNGLSDGK